MSSSTNLAKSAIDLTKEIIYKNDSVDQKTLSKLLRIIHFNDVYNIESGNKEPKAGAARFLTAIDYLRQENVENTLVLFSGDAFAPSALSYVTKGKQMPPVLNKFGINVCCVGNHDFDFGIERLTELVNETNFPWIISNLKDGKTKNPVANGHIKHVVALNNLKIGVIGLVEKEWVNDIPLPKDLIYEDFIDIGKKLADELRSEDKVDFVIALTHMRIPNDIKLANHVPEIDLILGGHDHHYVAQKPDKKWVVKSGSDFKELSLIEIGIDENNNEALVNKIEKYIIDSKIPENQEVKEIVDQFLKIDEKERSKVLGYVDVDLDGRFSFIRCNETLLGNFICDVMRKSVGADCAILNAGSIRCDCIMHSGPLTYGDMKRIIPSPFPVVMTSCNGKVIYEILENSVSSLPKLDGKFLQVSGIQYAFNLNKPIGSRVNPDLIRVQGEPLDFNRTYKLATKMFIKRGNDGYKMLEKCPLLIDLESGPYIFLEIEKYLKNNHIVPMNEKRIISLTSEEMEQEMVNNPNIFFGTES